jgi:hypothetical protein
MNKSIEELLDKGDWKLGFAAWIFAGYSPLKKQKSGVIVRLADEEEIPFGSFEYREAEKAKNKIKERLAVRVMASRGLDFIAARDRFSRNWLIDIAISSTIDESEGHDIDVWWAQWACKKHYLPAYIVPSALSLDELKKRSSFTWHKPSSDLTFAPREYSLSGYYVGTYDESAQVDTAREEMMPLFMEGSVKPAEHSNDDQSKYALFQFFYNVIAKQISVVPEKQAEIGGVKKHGLPRPTAAFARDLIVDAAKHTLNDWYIRKSNYGGELEWIYRNGEEFGSDDKQWNDVSRCHALTMNALAQRIRDWFNKTDEGLAYDEFFGLNTTVFGKGDKSS